MTPVSSIWIALAALVSIMGGTGPAVGGDGALLVTDASNQPIALSRAAFEIDAGDRLSLPVLNGQQFEAVFDRADTRQPGGQLWVGHIAGGESWHRVILTEGNGTLFGMFVTPGGVWTLGPETAGGPPMLRADSSLTIDPDIHDMNATLPAGLAAAVRDLDAPHGMLAATAANETASAGDVPVGSNGTVDVGIVYTPEIAALYGIATLTRFQYLVNLYDQALIDSDTGMRARLAHAGPLPIAWDEMTSIAQTLDDLFAGAGFGNAGTSEDATGTCILADNGEACVNDGDLSSLFALRNDKAIDILVFVRRYHRINAGGCGIARVSAQGLIGVMDPAVEHVNGVVVLSDGIDVDGTGTACADVIMAHEIGHNMGLLHNLEFSGPLTGIHDFAYGYQATCRFKTIQSYDSGGSVVCEDNNPPTRANELRLVRYSNPEQTDCQGEACGVNLPDGVVADTTNGPVATDSARSLRLAGHNVGLFRDPPAPTVRSAVLPYSRAVRNGATATAFATIINPASSGDTATGCRLVLHGASPGEFSYRTTDPATNAVTGTADTPVDIPAGASQSFVFSLTRATSFSGSDLLIDAQCDNRRSSESIPGVNSFRFLSTSLALPDIIALSATVGNTGVLELPSETGAAAFSVAIANIGSLSNVTVSVVPGAGAEPMGTIEFCRTDPQTGVCVAPRAASRVEFINADQTLTFAVFVRGAGALANAPATNRVFVNFTAPSGQSVGATSVAVRTAG